MTFRQAQKYEKGTNRVPAPTLAHIARSLDVDLAYLLDEDLPPAGTGARAMVASDLASLRRELAALADAVLLIEKAVDRIERGLGGAGEAAGLDA